MKILKYIIPCSLLLLSCIIGLSSLRAQGRENFAYTVSGTVKSASTKQPLPGISITLPGVSSAMTDDNGQYTIKLPTASVILHVSGPGFTGKDISSRDRSAIDIELYEEGFKSTFDNIVAPSGDISPLKITNAWTPIKENAILSTGATADAILQGKVAGLNVVYRSGAPGDGANIYLRGFNTMHAGSQPLYILDGIPYENSAYSASLVGNYFANPLASIDMKDIESITVLKDGTSQYGVKGTNGVILIRTIRAKEMETKINFHMHTGISFEPATIPVLGATDHKLLLSDLLQSSGLSTSQIQGLPYINSERPVKELWGYEGNVDYYRYNHNTNWQKELYDPSFNQNYYMNVFGGDEVALYALSIGFLDQGGTVKNTNYQRFNTRFNSEVKLSNKFKMAANMSFVYGTRDMVDQGPYVNTNPVLSALTKSPFMATNIYSTEGRISPVIEGVDIFGRSNPSSLVNMSDRQNNQYRFIGNFGGEYVFNEQLKANALLGVNFNKERERIFYPVTGVAFDTLALGAVRNKLQHRVDRLFSLYGEGSVSYDASFNYIHNLSVRGGARYQNNQAEDDWGKGYNSSSNNFKSVNYGDPLLRQIGGQVSNWNWMSIFATVDYSLKSKYFLNLTASADASSRYGKDVSTFLLYPSVSGAWLLTGEEFLRGSDLFDVLKLRVGYGITGNDDIGNYAGKQYYLPQNILGTYGLTRGNLAYFDLKPEKSSRFNVGLDASFLNERVNLSVDWYNNKVSDMITQSSAPRISGFDYYITNDGTMENTGVDFSLNTRILDGPLKWNLGLTVSKYTNEVTGLKDNEYITSVCGAQILTKKGNPLGVFYGYKTNGVYATQGEAATDGLGIMQGLVRAPFAAGDVRFVNQNPGVDNLINEDDRVVIGDPNPDVYGSISSNFTYDRWNLDVFMTYSVGNDVYNYTRAQLESMTNMDNQTQAVRNRWKVEGDVTDVPRAVLGDPMGNSRFSDRWIEDGSYLKLKAVTLAYKLPINYNVLRSCTFFMTGENLLTLTKYKGLDPEFQLGQSPLYYGIDGGFIPHPKTLSVGFKLEL
ncbi:SusC/RagA family TonB-linked outer membrane protein [Viscerimonas tarda]